MQDLGINVLFQGRNLMRLIGGVGVAIKIALIAMVLSALLGMLLGIVMTSKHKGIRALCRIYLEAIRIIPILVWLFLFYFSLTKVIGYHIDAQIISIIVFTLWGTAEMGDIVRGAITSMPQVQSDSGRAIGLTEIQIYRYIIIPQAVRRMLPAAINLATRMVKTTSLIVLIGVVEVLKVGQQIIEASILKVPSAPLWVYGFIFILYFIICYPISIFSRKLEKKWQS